jgi:hypothetical protein
VVKHRQKNLTLVNLVGVCGINLRLSLIVILASFPISSCDNTKLEYTHYDSGAIKTYYTYKDGMRNGEAKVGSDEKSRAND